jgi:transposase
LPDHLDRHEEVLSPGDDCTRCGGKLKTRAMSGSGVRAI